MAGELTTSAPVRVVDSERGQEVAIEGRIDVRSAADLRLALHAAIGDGVGDLYLHLGDVEEVGTTEAAMEDEAAAIKRSNNQHPDHEGRRLVLASITPRTARLLRYARLHRVFHVAVPATVAPLTA